MVKKMKFYNMATLEKLAILDALSESNYSFRKAAQLLGVSRELLRRRVAEYGIKPYSQKEIKAKIKSDVKRVLAEVEDKTRKSGLVV